MEPEEKRKIIGKHFVDVFAAEEKKLGKEGSFYLAQGTIYPDRIESGLGISAKIKSHHNVGGLPKDMDFLGLVEPLQDLFKDEVRQIGRLLGLPESIVSRQPFPGPGLGIRVVGEVTPEKVHIVQEADAIFREEMEKAGAAKTTEWYMHLPAGIYPYHMEGIEDNTHLKYLGAVVYAGCIAKGLKELGGIYADLLIDFEQERGNENTLES